MANFLSYARSGVFAVAVGTGTAIAVDLVMDYAVRPIVGQPLNNAGLVAAAAGGFLLGASAAGLGAYAGDQLMDYVAGEDFLSHAFFYPVFAMNCRAVQTASGSLRSLARSMTADMQARSSQMPAPATSPVPGAVNFNSNRNYSTCGGGCGNK